MYIDPERAIFVSNIGSRTTETKDTVLADDHIPLSNVYKQKQPCRDIKVHVGEGFLGGQMSPDRVDSEYGQGLIGTEEEFVGESTEERHREQDNEP